MKIEIPSGGQSRSLSLLIPANVFLIALCVLSYEIALTRVFSVIFRSPYVFLVVSGAVCGLGLGGMIAAKLPKLQEEPLFHRRLSGVLLLFAVGLGATVLVLFGTPLAPLLGGQAEGWVVGGVPLVVFTLAGVFLAEVFARYGQAGGWLYFADLCGAALGCLMVILALQFLGGLNTPLALAGLAAGGASALAWWGGRAGGLTVLGAAVGVGHLILCAGNVSQRWIDLPALANVPPDCPYVKPLYQELGNPAIGARIEYSEWNAFARTDVVSNAGTDTLYIYTDGDVPTQMEPFNGDFAQADSFLSLCIGLFPYRVRRPERVLCIGPGGGLDVLLALRGGAQEIHAVELNPSILRITDRYRAFYGDLYRWKNVRVWVDEGRSFVRRQGQQYDLIYMALAKTATTETMGLALVENYLYTEEAFRDYFQRLSARGWIAIVMQSPALTDRIALTALAALMKTGLPTDQAVRHIAVVALPQSLWPMGPYRYLLLVSRGAIGPAEGEKLLKTALASHLVPIFVPHAFESAPYYLLTAGRLSLTEVATEFGRLYETRGEPLNLNSVRDDSPFYADLSRGLHPQLAHLLYGTLGLAGAFVLWVLFSPGSRRRAPEEGQQRGKEGGAEGSNTPPLPHTPGCRLPLLAYFACLGVGFMLIEVALIQKSVLFLGYPTLSLSSVLFALLLSGSAGSLFSQRWSSRGALTQVGHRLVPALGVILVVYQVGLGHVFHACLAWPILARCGVAMLLMVPVGFLLGIPFPSGIRWLSERDERQVPEMWGVNGIFSVLGGVGAMACAKWGGYSATLLVGGVAYVLAAVLARRMAIKCN